MKRIRRMPGNYNTDESLTLSGCLIASLCVIAFGVFVAIVGYILLS